MSKQRGRARHTAVIASVLLTFGAAATGLAPPAAADAVRTGQWYLAPMGITSAQAVTTGVGVRVAVIDTGVDGAADDLRGAVVAGKDFSGEGSAKGGPVNGSAHGTNVASLLAGRGHGARRLNGVLGSAPGAEVISAAVDNVSDTNIEQLIDAIRWSADQDVKVINMSVGGGRTDAELAAYRYAQSKDIVIVAASGNEGETSGSAPCGIAGVVCVGGVDKNLVRDPDSNQDEQLAVVGPYATVAGAYKSSSPREGLPVLEPVTAPNKYSGQSGTSLAAPVVAGVVALIRAKWPKLDAANVVNRLIRTATPAGSGTPNSSYGYGMVNAERALTATVPSVNKNPFGTLVSATVPESTEPASTGASTDGLPVAGPADTSSNTGLLVGIVAAALVVPGALVGIFVWRKRMRGNTTSG